MIKLLVLSVLIYGLTTCDLHAQEALPELPAPIQTLVDEGAQIRFLGRDKGFDGWLTIKNGQEQYFYVRPDRSAFLMGVLFDDKGEMITVDQVQRWRMKLCPPMGIQNLRSKRLSSNLRLSVYFTTLRIATGSRWVILARLFFIVLLTRNARIVIALLRMSAKRLMRDSYKFA